MILHVGLSCRDSFDEYGRRPEFSDSVKKAKLFIENGYEVDLRRTGNPVGSIFALKNMGWSDRTEVEFRGVLANVDLTKLPDALVARIAAGENPPAVLAGAVAAGLDAGSFLSSPPLRPSGCRRRQRRMDGTRLGPDDNRRDGGDEVGREK